MKKIIAIISTVTLLMLNSASAEVMGLNVGITGSILDIQADGTETTKTSGEKRLRKAGFSGFPEFQKSGFSELREQDVGFLEASDAGHRRCPDPTQKH